MYHVEANKRSSLLKKGQGMVGSYYMSYESDVGVGAELKITFYITDGKTFSGLEFPGLRELI